MVLFSCMDVKEEALAMLTLHMTGRVKKMWSLEKAGV
jgi:hypothetical protein